MLMLPALVIVGLVSGAVGVLRSDSYDNLLVEFVFWFAGGYFCALMAVTVAASLVILAKVVGF